MEKRTLPDTRRCGDLGGCGLGVAFLQKERHCRAQHIPGGDAAGHIKHALPHRFGKTLADGISLLKGA